MNASVIGPDAANRKRFWLWLVAALLAIAFLLLILGWTAPPTTSGLAALLLPISLRRSAGNKMEK